MRYLLALLVAMTGSAQAQGWERLTGDEVAMLLTGAKVTFAEALQTFDWRGATIHTHDRATEGRWREVGDQYCSVWPPSDRWVCYDVTGKGNAVRLIGPDQSVPQGVVAR